MMSDRELGKIIENPEEKIMNLIEVYCYDFFRGELNLKRLEKTYNENGYITLKDISDLYPKGCYKVIYETPKGGEIYRYNNYNSQEWQLIGIMYGYA